MTSSDHDNQQQGSNSNRTRSSSFFSSWLGFASSPTEGAANPSHQDRATSGPAFHGNGHSGDYTLRKTDSGASYTEGSVLSHFRGQRSASVGSNGPNSNAYANANAGSNRHNSESAIAEDSYVEHSTPIAMNNPSHMGRRLPSLASDSESISPDEAFNLARANSRKAMGVHGRRSSKGRFEAMGLVAAYSGGPSSF